MDEVAQLCRAQGVRAVVTSAAPIAASIGIAMFHEGGNVYDAAVAAALAETVLLPPKCGLAGDVVALAVESGQKPRALVSVGGAAKGLAAEVTARGLPRTGGLSVGIPGAPAGYMEIARRSRLPLERLVAPAVALAREGFPWSPVNELLTQQSEKLLRRENPDGVVYLPEGQPVSAGRPVRLPSLAIVLEEFALREEHLFDGPLGDTFAAAVQERGGIITKDELTSSRPRWSSAAEVNVGEFLLWATPAPTHGPSLLDAASRFPTVTDQGTLVQCVEDAIERRRVNLADVEDGGTSVVSVADGEGNAVLIVHSNSFQRYGSGIVLSPYGLVLSNRAGRGFSNVPGDANFPASGRRPATTLNAWAAGTRRGVRFLGATPGSENQMRWNSQTLAALLRGERDPGRLVSAPRWGRYGDELLVEEGFDPENIQSLLSLGTTVRIVQRRSLRSAQQVICLAEPGDVLCAGADPRTGAAALAL